MADRVFEDRAGLWIIDPAQLPLRMPAIAALQGGIFRDLFLGRDALPADFAIARGGGFYAHLRVSPDGLTAREYAERTISDVMRLNPGALELNIELPTDEPLRAYIREAVLRLRSRFPNRRMRVNVAPWKARFLPADLLQTDPALYACEQPYEGNMERRLSEADVLADLLTFGVPAEKATLCYGAAGLVPERTERVCWLPDLRRTRRGVVFQDDLLHEVGLLP